MMQLTGNLKNSIPIKIFTNPQASRVIIRQILIEQKILKESFTVLIT